MSLIGFGKRILKNNNWMIEAALALYNKMPFNNRTVMKGRHNKIEKVQSLLKHTNIRVKGSENQIIFNRRCTLRNCKINITGNNNTIRFGEKVSMINGEIHIEDDGNAIRVGSQTSFLGKTHLACIEGTEIVIGEACLFSSEVVLRTGDSHAILNGDGQRVNQSQSIVLSNHVWAGNRSIITKCVSIQSDSIVATGALVTKSVEEPNVIIGGVPAGIIKRGINWDINRK